MTVTIGRRELLAALGPPGPNRRDHLLQRTFPAGFIAPCLPSKSDKLPSGDVLPLPGCAQESGPLWTSWPDMA